MMQGREPSGVLSIGTRSSS